MSFMYTLKPNFVLNLLFATRQSRASVPSPKQIHSDDRHKLAGKFAEKLLAYLRESFEHCMVR